MSNARRFPLFAAAALLALAGAAKAAPNALFVTCTDDMSIHSCMVDWNARFREAKCDFKPVRCKYMKAAGGIGCNYTSTNCKLVRSACPADYTIGLSDFFGSLCRSLGAKGGTAPPLPDRGLMHTCAKSQFNTAADCWKATQGEYARIGCKVTGGGCGQRPDGWLCRVATRNCTDAYAGDCGYEKNVSAKMTSQRGICVKK